MSLRFPRKSFIINWLKAFMLSPGVLFPAGYLLLNLATNIYLNTDFKESLTESVNKSTDHNWQIRITSLRSGWVFDSFSLNHIELTRTATLEGGETSYKRIITIKTLEIPFPHLENLLFDSNDRISTINAVSKIILAQENRSQ